MTSGEYVDTMLTVKSHENLFSVLNSKMFKLDEKLSLFGQALDDITRQIDSLYLQVHNRPSNSGQQARQGPFGSIDAQSGKFVDNTVLKVNPSTYNDLV